MHFLPARRRKKSLHLLFGILTSCTFFLQSIKDDRESSEISMTGDICIAISLKKTFVNRLLASAKILPFRSISEARPDASHYSYAK